MLKVTIKCRAYVFFGKIALSSIIPNCIMEKTIYYRTFPS
jgi:hypothetical protein